MLSARRTFGSIVLGHCRFSIWAAAPVTFSISAGYLVTLGSGLIQMRSRSFAEQLISSRPAGWSGVSNRERPVTGHRVCFHRLARTENGEWLEWTPANWEFFIKDIRTRFLKPEGRLLLEFNRRQDGSSFFTDELRVFFESQGARIFRWKALLAADPNQRPLFKQIQKL